MMQALKKQGAAIEEKFPGIYYVKGLVSFATQIVVTSRLSKEMHSSLRVLSKAAQAEDIKIFLEEAETMRLPGDRHNISAVLRVSVDANQSVYDRVKEDETMGDALRELMKDELEEAHANGIEEGMERGIQRGMEEGILSSISNLMKSMKLTAEQAMDALGIPKNERASYNAKLIK
jgi:flagellar biosynthesis/type III secretory pathway protein FliH